jgi:tetratricopeptide (TPR) repeat protein
MAIYYRNTNSTWEQYLKNNQAIIKNDKVIQSLEKIDRKLTLNTVANIGTALMTYKISNLLIEQNKEIANIEYDLSLLSGGVENLRADFNYAMGLVMSQLEMENKNIETVISKLDDIHKILESPILTQAKEFRNRGMELLKRKLLTEALEAFLESEKRNKTDFFVQYQIGKLYLYGVYKDDYREDIIVDLPKAEEHLKLACRYSEAEIEFVPEAKKLCSETWFHLSICYYVQSNQKFKEKDITALQEYLNSAIKSIEKAIKIFPHSPELFYNYAKFLALAGDKNGSLKNLDIAVQIDKNYLIKADLDPDFDNLKSELLNYANNFVKFSEEAKKQRQDLIEVIKEIHFDEINLIITKFFLQQIEERIKINKNLALKIGLNIDNLLKLHREIERLLYDTNFQKLKDDVKTFQETQEKTSDEYFNLIERIKTEIEKNKDTFSFILESVKNIKDIERTYIENITKRIAEEEKLYNDKKNAIIPVPVFYIFLSFLVIFFLVYWLTSYLPEPSILGSLIWSGIIFFLILYYIGLKDIFNIKYKQYNKHRQRLGEIHKMKLPYMELELRAEDDKTFDIRGATKAEIIEALKLILERRRVSQDLLEFHFGSSVKATNILAFLETNGFIYRFRGSNEWVVYFEKIEKQVYFDKIENLAKHGAK